MAAPRSSARRRQRSALVTGSVVLLSVATVLVCASLPAQVPLWLSLASAGAVALAWLALRVMWGEVVQTRRENAADRAAAAAAYRTLFGVRAAEHAEFVTAMTERLAEAHLCQRELEGLLTQHESRAQRAEARLAEACAQVRSLEETVAGLRSEEVVADLVAWEEQAAQKAQEQGRKTPRRQLEQA